MKMHKKPLAGSALPSTAQMLNETQKLTADLRVKELRGLGAGLIVRPESAFQSLGRLLLEVAQEHEALVAEWHTSGGYASAARGVENRFRERLWFSPACLIAQRGLFETAKGAASC